MISCENIKGALSQCTEPTRVVISFKSTDKHVYDITSLLITRFLYEVPSFYEIFQKGEKIRAELNSTQFQK